MNKALDLLREIRPSIPKEVLELWCKDRDAFLASHPAVEQAGGDERAAFERAFTVQEGIYFDDKRGEYRSMNLCAIEASDAQDLNLQLQGWQARAALAQPSPKCVKCGGTGEADSGGVHPWGEPVLIPCDCETEQAEAERPEVAEVAFVLRNIGAMDAEDIDGDNVDLRFEDAEGRDTGCDVSIVEYAEKAADLFEQHDRIVGALRAENAKLSEALDRWPLIRDSLKLRLADALARCAELEAKLSDPTAVHQWQFSNAWFDCSKEALLKAGKEGSPIRTLYTAPAQAQHSVPETTNEEANSFLRVADAGQFKDNAAAVRTAAMIILGLLHRPAIMKSIIRHRIGLTPEYEGQWHADMYGEDGEVQHHAEADTPDEAVRAVVALAAAPGKEVGHE
ncbi:TPA: hypothetical protein OUI22_000371 [Pseudomonas aeruginosa]|nr:hypothetical protein [Pseudomonas aeruginosa]